MIASHLCVFDEKTDSKSKWFQNKLILILNSIVCLCFPDYLADLFCENLNVWRFAAIYYGCMQSEYIMPYLKELEKVKLSPSTKGATVDKFITKKDTRSSIECWDHCEKIKTIS